MTPEELLELLVGRKDLKMEKSDADSTLLNATYLSYLFGGPSDDGLSSNKIKYGVLSTERVKSFVWGQDDVVINMQADVMPIRDILTRCKSSCEFCLNFHMLMLGAIKKLGEEHWKQLSEIRTNAKGDYNRCKDASVIFVRDNPKCLGFDGFFNMDKECPTFESGESEFCSALLDFIKNRLIPKGCTIWGTTMVKLNTLAGNKKIETLGDFDILILAKNGEKYVLFQIENKFGKSLKDQDYIQFFKRQSFLRHQFFTLFKERVRCVSILFAPRVKENIFEKTDAAIIQGLKNGVSHVNDHVQLHEYMQNNEMILSGGFFPNENEKFLEIIKNDVSSEVESHIEDLVDKIFSMIEK